MRRIFRTRAVRRLAVLLTAAAPLLVAHTAPAWAAVPPNDDITNATVIGSLPFHDAADISQATFAATDQSFCWGQGQSVWYQFTPATSGQVAFDASNSNQPMAIDVFTGSPGALSFVGCGQGGGGDGGTGGYLLNATAGTTYWVMASPICCITTPSLDLWVYQAAAPQATVSVTGATRDQAGNALITGTLTCTGVVPAPISISGTIRQPVGRKSSVTASFQTTVSCGQAQKWSALAQPQAGKFTGGPATVDVGPLLVCNMMGCATPSDTEVVKLSG